MNNNGIEIIPKAIESYFEEIKSEKVSSKQIPQIHIPSAFDQQSKEISHNITIISDKDSLLEELDEILMENEIEQQITLLTNNIDLTEASVSMEELIRQYPHWSAKVLGTGLEFLNIILPSNIRDSSYLECSLDSLIRINSLAKIFINATGNGARLIAVICKEKMIDQSQMLIQKAKLDLQSRKNFSNLDPVELANIQKFLRQWEAGISAQRKKLKQEKIELGISASLLAGLAGLEVLKYFPVESFSLFGNILGIFGDAIITVDSGVTYFMNRNDMRTFRDWNTRYENWTKDNTLIYDTLNKEMNSPEALKKQQEEFLQRASDLLSNRERIMRDVESRFQTMEPKIYESLYAINQQSIDKVVNYLRNPSIPYLDIKTFFNDLMLAEDDPATLALRQAFNNFKAMLVDSQAKPKDVRFAKRALIDEFENWKKNEFQNWYAQQTPQELSRSYAERHVIVDHTVKNAVKEIIKNKNILEKKFLNFNLKTSGVSFTASLVCLALSASIIILGVLTAPFWGMGFMLLALSSTPIAIILGFMVIGFLFSMKEKPLSSKALLSGLSAKVIWKKIRKGISVYQHQNKVKKLEKMAAILRPLHILHLSSDDKSSSSSDSTYQQAKLDFEKAKIESKNSEDKVKKWQENLLRYQRIQWDKAWQDFTTHSGLAIGKSSLDFDSLKALSEALRDCDLSLLSDETKYLLETQLGINLDLLYKQIRSQPEVFEMAFKQYSMLSEDSLLSFIRKQESNIESKVIGL
jgi:hypothetical protein